MKKIKIFVTLGSQQFQFNRLLKELDDLNNDLYDIYAQIGYSTYKPRNYCYVDFIDRNEYNKRIFESDMIITHAGTGAIISSLKASKPVLAVARLSKYNEHVDDHQIEIMELFVEKKYINGISEIINLDSVINDTLTKNYEVFKSNTDIFIRGLEELIEK